jgi:hypothetical protein
MLELLGLPYSPWSEKARWALDARGIAYQRRKLDPIVGLDLLGKLAGCTGKSLKFIGKLIAAGVDPDFVADEVTPLLHSIIAGNTRFARELLKFELDTRSKYYAAALAWAKRDGYQGLCREMVARKKRRGVAVSGS